MAVGRSGYGADFDSTLGRIISSVSEVWISQEREGKERKSRERDVLEGSWKMLHAVICHILYRLGAAYIDCSLQFYAECASIFRVLELNVLDVGLVESNVSGLCR